MIHPRFDANGWQAVVADKFTFERLRLVTQAFCNCLQRQQRYIDNFPPRLVIGYDSRFMGSHFAQIAAEIVLLNGLDVFMSDRAAPTPVVSWMISDRVGSAAIMITGANESQEFNGVKLITSHMAMVSEDFSETLENEIARLSKDKNYVNYQLNPGEKEVVNPKPAYFQELKNYVDLEDISRSGVHLVVDYLYGVASGYLKETFHGSPMQIEEIQNNPQADFGGLTPSLMKENLEEIRLTLNARQNPMALGVVIDGDGSHLQFLTHEGHAVSHDDLLALLIHHMAHYKGYHGPVIKSQITGGLAESIAHHYGLPIICSKTSDFREIANKMVKHQAIIASDDLGGLAYQGHILERDAILSTLLVLEFLAETKIPLAKAISDLKLMTQSAA